MAGFRFYRVSRHFAVLSNLSRRPASHADLKFSFMDARALNVLEFPKLLAYLSGFAVSEAGSRACLDLRPASSLDELQKLNLFFEQGRRWLELTGFKLVNFPPLDGVFSFLNTRKDPLDLDGLWTMRQVLGQCRGLTDSIRQEEKQDIPWPLLLEFASARPLPEKSISGLSRCISEDGLLRDEASPELLLVRGEIRRIHQQCNRKAGEFIREYNLSHFLQDEYITLASDRYVLPLKSNFKGRFQGIIHDYSQTGETCYFEPMFLVELNNRLQELKREEREEERRVFLYLSGLLRDEQPLVENAYKLLVEADLLQARQRLAQVYDGALVRFDDGLPVDLKDARHPLLVLAHLLPKKAERLGAKAQVMPVGTDISLKTGQKALIISGGNAGGKTVALKTLGLVTLMGMCAIPAPVAAGGSLPFWPQIQAFIGDEQSLEDHVSTFTAQITQLADGWEALGGDTLVILDEFGAGTDPSQGAALAQAVIDGMLEKGAYVFAATHFPALKAYALSREGVRAASVLFDPKSKKPLYRLIYDQVGASQALDVAREHGLPETVLKKAQQYLLLDGEDTGQIMDRLNTLAVEREKEADSLKREINSYKAKRQALEDRFAKEKQKLFDSVQAQAQEVLRDWKTAKATHKQTLKNLSKLRADILKTDTEAESATPVDAPDLAKLRVGDSFLYVPWNKTGKALEVDTRKNRVRLDLSGVTMWVDAADLAFAQAKTTASKESAASLPSAQGFALRLDLRGQRAEAALNELDSFIDSAILSGRESLEILHGRGTGALRREIHAYIKNHPQVSSFTLAPEDQGGDGVTLITLK